MALDVSEFVQVTTRIAAGGTPRLAFGRGLLVTENDALAPSGSGKIRLFNDLSDVEDVLGRGDAYDAAAVWFAADPAPQGLYIGRWAPGDVDTVLRGSVDPARDFDADPLNVANGSFTLNGMAATGIDLSSATDAAAVGAAILTAINGLTGISGATIETTGNRFEITFSTPLVIEGGGLGDATTGTAIAAALGLDADSADYLPGIGAETITATVATMIGLASGGQPTAIMLADDASLVYGATADDTRLDLAAWAETQDVIFYMRETADDALVTGDTTSHAARVLAANYGNTAAVYAAAGQHPEVGFAALLSAQDFSQPASIITPHRKIVPGVVGVDLTDVQWAELKRKRTSAVATVGGGTYLVGGWTSRAGYWADAVHFLLWLQTEIETAIWSAMGSSRRFAAAELADALNQALQNAVVSGGLERGGTVSAATKADIISTLNLRDFDGTLSAGFLVWVNMTPTAADRENRVGDFKVWVVGAGAIHEVAGNVIFTN